MARDGKETAAERLLLAFQMMEDGFALKREQLRREHPNATEEELNGLFDAWLMDRPMDAPGKPVPWPRRK